MTAPTYTGSPLTELLEKTASSDPAPGGGAVAAVTAASAAALLEMTANLTIGKSGYEEARQTMDHIRRHARDIRQQCLKGIDADAAAFEGVLAALHLPKEHDDRAECIEEAFKHAAQVPFDLSRQAWEVLNLSIPAVEQGNKWVISDAVIAALNARAAMRSAFYNVRINLASIKDTTFVQVMNQTMKEMEADASTKERRIADLYAGRQKK